MIDVAQAVAAASEYLRSLHEQLHKEPPLDLELEEIDQSQDGRWLITLGYRERGAVRGLPGSRKYKVFRVNKRSGVVESMKIRETAAQ